MLNKRLIACLVIKNGIVVQSINFKQYLPIGRPEIAVEFLNSWGVDEIVLLDIDATPNKRSPNLEMVSRISRYGFVPLAIGGGIKTISDIRALVQAGADKIAINQIAIANPTVITEAARVFGCQCIIVSIDMKRNQDGEYEVFTNSGRKPTGFSPWNWAKQVESLGAGEIFLNSIDRDGCQEGYDLEVIEKVANVVSVPVIVCGGVGHPQHFVEAARIENVSAVAAANFFHFSEHSIITTKAYLENTNINVRLDSYANYRDCLFDDNGRLAKKTDDYLENLRFEFYPKEVI
ncbi:MULTISPECIES: imidazole glycerol phosphate synthase cyclase subunit [Spirulina sp. CCY15215]|uniref:imidazole glycerol phosphate synthase subunit HisF n=1 Tax=Spirulina sp. CCY15215 TaxID=2767591 RepID=UPI00194E27F8